MALGNKKPRINVASINTPTANPTPICCKPRKCPPTNPLTAATKIKAAAVTTPPVFAIPSTIASSLVAPRSIASRILETMKTS